MEKKLGRSFFDQPTLTVAQKLLGKYLVHQIGKKKLIAQIIETEAYVGFDDKASHASFGKTKRCWPMYEQGGIAYIYLIYGVYWMFNIVTEKKGIPGAVLIRAVEPQREIEKLKRIGSGPGKLCRWLKIDNRFNGEDLTKSKKLFVINGGKKVKASQVVRTKRIGVDYAGQWAEKPWRFYLKNNPFVSRK